LIKVLVRNQDLLGKRDVLEKKKDILLDVTTIKKDLGKMIFMKEEASVDQERTIGHGKNHLDPSNMV
jgi:hypothetical protein